MYFWGEEKQSVKGWFPQIIYTVITVEIKIQPALISKRTIIPSFTLRFQGFVAENSSIFMDWVNKLRDPRDCCSGGSYSLIPLSLHIKGRNCKCYTRQERSCVFANFKLWLPCASASCLRVFHLRHRSRGTDENYWPWTLTVNLVSCIMQRDLTVQKLPAQHLWHNAIATLGALRGWGAALWLHSLWKNTLLLFCWATWQNISSLLYTW